MLCSTPCPGLPDLRRFVLGQVSDAEAEAKIEGESAKRDR